MLYCKCKTERRNLKIDGSVRGVERTMHPVSRGEERNLFVIELSGNTKIQRKIGAVSG